MTARIALIGLAVLLALPADAQQVRVRAPFDSVSVGERFNVTVVIDHDGTRQAVFPDQVGSADGAADLIGTLGSIELLRRRSSGGRLLTGGGRRDSVIYEATTFALDSVYVVPEMRLATERDTALVAAGGPVVFPVRSIVPDDASEIQALKPIVEFPRSWWPLILALLVLAGILAWFIRSRRRDPEADLAPELVEPLESPAEEALRRLAALEGAVLGDTPLDDTPLDDADAVKAFHVELSDIARTYLARRLRVPAREQTTAEIIDSLTALPAGPSDAVVQRLRELLESADLVKFADYRPGADRAREALGRTRGTVERVETEFRADEASGDGQASPEAELPSNPSGGIPS